MPGDRLSVVFDGNSWRDVSRVVAKVKVLKKDPYLDGVFGTIDGLIEPLYDTVTISSNMQAKKKRNRPMVDGVNASWVQAARLSKSGSRLSEAQVKIAIADVRADISKPKKRVKIKPKLVLQKVEPLYRRKFNFDE